MSAFPKAIREEYLQRWQRPVIAALACALLLACVIVLRPFLSSILWAAVLAYTTWQPYQLVRARCRGSDTVAASIMTALVMVVVLGSLVGIVTVLLYELRDGYKAAATYLAESHALPPQIRAIPWLGAPLQEVLDRLSGSPGAIQAELLDAIQRFRTELVAAAGDVGRNAVKILTILLTLFFFYRDGGTIAWQFNRLSQRLQLARLNPFAKTAGQITRAVLYGFLVTVVAQGLIAGIGYWLFGVPEPVLLGVLTGFLSILPVFGTAFVWVPAAVYLLASEHVLGGVLLVLWGILIVHPTDNLVRPLVISRVTRLPLLAVMFGVVGGLAVFGLVGAVVGPVLLGLGVELWSQLTLTPAKGKPLQRVRTFYEESHDGNASS